MQGPRRAVRAIAAGALAAGLVGIVGSRLVWAEVSGFARQGATVLDPVIRGSEVGVGGFCLALSAAICVLSAVLLRAPVLGCAIALLSVGCVLLLVGAMNVLALDRIAGPSIERYGLDASIGAGLWMTVLAGAASSALGLAAVVRASSRERLPSRWDAPPPPR